MLLTPHILSGMLFGSFASDYRISPLLGLFSYFILELIPHWDPEGSSKTAVKIIRYVDFCLAFIAFIIVILLKQTSGNLSSGGMILDPRYVLGGISAAIPYIIFDIGSLVFRDYSKFRFLDKMRKLFKYSDKSIWGLLIQASICIICISVLFNLVDFPTWNKLILEFGGKQSTL